MTTAVLMEPLLVIHEALIYTKQITRVYIHKFVKVFFLKHYNLYLKRSSKKKSITYRLQ